MQQIAAWEAAEPEARDSHERLANAIASSATEYFRGPRISKLSPSLRRHAFAGIGWARFPDGVEHEPYLMKIANFDDGDAEARDEFDVKIARLKGKKWLYRRIGEQLTPDLRAPLHALFDRLDSNDPDYADLIWHGLGTIIRKVADRVETVGKDLMITVMPRGGIRDDGSTGFSMMLGGSQCDAQTYMYWPHEDDGNVIAYMPAYVGDGVVLWDGEISRTLPRGLNLDR